MSDNLIPGVREQPTVSLRWESKNGTPDEVSRRMLYRRRSFGRFLSQKIDLPTILQYITLLGSL